MRSWRIWSTAATRAAGLHPSFALCLLTFAFTGFARQELFDEAAQLFERGVRDDSIDACFDARRESSRGERVGDDVGARTQSAPPALFARVAQVERVRADARGDEEDPRPFEKGGPARDDRDEGVGRRSRS